MNAQPASRPPPRLATCATWFAVVSIVGAGLGADRAWSKATASGVPPSKATALASEASNAFAFDLYHRLATGPGNLFFSPLDISSALAMTYAGAAGATAEEVARVLHLPNDQARVHDSFGALLESVESGVAEDAEGGASATAQYRLSTANRLWGRKGLPFREPFLKTTRELYGAELQPLDFGGDSEGSRRTINAWVEEKTQGKIDELLRPGSVSPQTRLFLTSAIYFYGRWVKPFPAENTRPGPFHVSVEKTVEATLMGEHGRYSFGAFDGLSILALPYRGSRLEMVILLPDETENLGRVESQLSTAALKEWLSALHSADVIVTIPRFRSTLNMVLDGALKGMGMTTAWRPEVADFSGMTTVRGYFVSSVVHRSFVDVAEWGTEAAAATAVEITLGGSVVRESPKFFQADHPFVFLIRDGATDCIRFLGRLVDPTAMPE